MMDANSSFERGFERGFKAGVASSKEPAHYNHPLMSDAEVAAHLAQGMPLYEIMGRRTGKSTVQALRGLAWVIGHPGRVLRISDHHGTEMANRHLLDMMHRTANDLGLRNLVFNQADQTVVFKNPRSS